MKAGDILIAKPFLQDGRFKRSVIYLGEHSDQGSLGFILNKPHGLLLRDIFPHLKNGNFPLFDGGPVSSNQLFYTHTLGAKLSDSLEIGNGVYWGGNFFDLSQMIEQEEVSSAELRFYIGYSGWGQGQLSAELDNGSWFTNVAVYSELASQAPAELWRHELIKINPAYRAFADYAFDPSLN